ncbi:hypothetical protein MtrunA17_Chr2g0286461 [Medicago truncatula]|uniref:Transmembrane protein n=1 Tax=Medicago truncatula TaxID=3880 RepID=A0A396J6Y5_MEDTR|nr:hypothetical protein MtrunA17_Chr2g0286461 [Medicago truncatula]
MSPSQVNFNCSSHQMLLICFVMLITNQIIMLCLLFWVLEEEEAPPELDIDEIENLLYRGDSAIPIFQVDEDSGVDGDDGIEDIVIPRVIIDYGATSLDDYND